MQTNLTCPNCQNVVAKEQININALMAHCQSCNTVFSFGQDTSHAIFQKPEVVVMPSGIEAYHSFNELNIELNWRRSSRSFFFFFAAFWNAIVIPMAVFAILSGEIMFLLALSLHLAVGIGMAYYVAALFLNTSYIVVGRRKILIEHRPIRLPFRRDVHIESYQLAQIFIKRYVESTTNGNPNYAFAVEAILTKITWSKPTRLKLFSNASTP